MCVQRNCAGRASAAQRGQTPHNCKAHGSVHLQLVFKTAAAAPCTVPLQQSHFWSVSLLKDSRIATQQTSSSSLAVRRWVNTWTRRMSQSPFARGAAPAVQRPKLEQKKHLRSLRAARFKFWCDLKPPFQVVQAMAQLHEILQARLLHSAAGDASRGGLGKVA